MPPLDSWLMSQRLQVGGRLRSLREWRNLRQPRLAELAGVSRDTVYRVENATRALSADAAYLLSRALGVPVTWLFTDDWTQPGGGGTGSGEWSDDPPPTRQP